MESSASAGRVASAVLDPRRWWSLALVLLVYAVVKAPGADWGGIGTILPLAGSVVLVAAALALIESPLRAAGADPGLGGRPDDPDRHHRGRHAVPPDALCPAGARLLGPQVRHQLGRFRARSHGRRTRRPAATAGPALMAAGSLVLTQVPIHGSYFPDIFVGLLLCGLGIGLAFVTATVAAPAGVGEPEAGLASGLSTTALQTGTALVAIVTTVAVSSSRHYLAAHKGANPLAALTEGNQSAFLACAVLAGIGPALAFVLPGRAWKPAHEWSEPDSAADAAAAGDVVIRSGTK